MPPVAARLKAKCSMNDLISRSALLEELNDTKYAWQDYDAVEDALRNIPAVDAVVLPCKVGDVVYCITDVRWRFHPEIVKGFVDAIRWGKHGIKLIVHPDFNEQQWWAGASFSIENFGKTVFLTREEAEAAVKRRGKHEWN